MLLYISVSALFFFLRVNKLYSCSILLKSLNSWKTILSAFRQLEQTVFDKRKTTNNGSEAKTPEPKASVSDKKKFFEKAMEEHYQPSPKPERVFTFLSQDEVEKLKQEEEKKIASLRKNELNIWSKADEDGENDLSPEAEINTTPKLDGLNIGRVRSAKAERRRKEKLIQEGLLSEDEEKDLSPAEQRALKAEKRAAWRQARLKSLEQDALQAQMVIKTMTEMIDSKSIGNDDVPDATLINNNQAVMDHENNLAEVETTREKIISLELSTPTCVEAEGNQLEEEEGDEEVTTPTAEDHSTVSTKKKRKKKSKKGKH